MHRIGFAIVAVLLTSSCRSVPATPRTLCGVSFVVPAGWTVSPNANDPEDGCSVGLRPENWAQVVASEKVIELGDSAFTLTVLRGPLEDAAALTLFHQEEDGQWMIAGRQDQQAEPAAFGAFHGLSGYGFAGFSRKGGGVAMGELLRVLVAHETGAVVYVESESYGNDRTIHEVLRSLIVD